MRKSVIVGTGVAVGLLTVTVAAAAIFLGTIMLDPEILDS